MIMLKQSTPSDHYKSKVNDVRVKSPTKTNTDLHNGDLKFSFSPSVILLGNIRCLQ